MELINADLDRATQYTDEIPDLVYATGPISYDYHFGSRAVLDAIVKRSWLTPGTLFSQDATTLAVEGDTLLGIMIAFEGPEYRARGDALGAIWPELLATGVADKAALAQVLEHSEHAHWLNPEIRPNTHYVHALSVKPEHKGKKVGMRLLSHGMEAARALGRKALELDVLSDNPAVHFYSSMGLELLVESRAPKPEAYGVPPERRMGILL